MVSRSGRPPPQLPRSAAHRSRGAAAAAPPICSRARRARRGCRSLPPPRWRRSPCIARTCRRSMAALVDALELTAFVAWCFAVALAGGLVGLVLGNIRLPLVLARDLARRRAQERTSASRASLRHRVDRARPRRPHQLAALRLDGAALDGGCRRGRLPVRAAARRRRCSPSSVLRCCTSASTCCGRAPRRAASSRSERPLDIRAAVITGAVIGVLGGLVGLILGALRMPALLRYVGETPAARSAPTWPWACAWAPRAWSATPPRASTGT